VHLKSTKGTPSVWLNFLTIDMRNTIRYVFVQRRFFLPPDMPQTRWMPWSILQRGGTGQYI
jgi:hypothetical protein